MTLRYLLLIVAIFSSSAVFAVSNVSHKEWESLYPTYPAPKVTSVQQAKLAKRGEYLAKLGDCIACHSNPREGGKAFAGGLPIATPFGTFYSPNITPDKETGIGKWSDDDFVRAMHDGIAPDGSNYFPVFPYMYFNKLSRQDLLAIKAYLFSIPAVKEKNKAPDVPPPFSWRIGQWGWKLLFFLPHRGELKNDPSKSTQWNRGRYIVEGLGHCAMCHTPLNPLGAPKRKYHLTGTFVDTFWAPNITAKAFADVSEQAIVDVFRHDQLVDHAGPVTGPMAEVDHNSLSHLTNRDLHAIAAYLKTVNSEEPMSAKNLTGKPVSKVGREVYYKACHVCHQEGGAGAPYIGDTPNWVKRYRETGEKMSVFYDRVIKGYNVMPIRGGCVECSDGELKAAVDYLVHRSMTKRQVEMSKLRPGPRPSMAKGKQIYDQACAVCHDSGRLNALPITSKAAWQKKLKAKGMAAFFNNVIHGLHNMPKKGGCKTCTNEELIAAVKYLVQESTGKDVSKW